MCSANHFLRETHIIGSGCRERAIDADNFPVLRNAPFIWVGHSVLKPPYRIVRLSSIHSHIVVNLEGRGRAYIDGQAVDWLPGQALLGPVGRHHGFEIAGSKPWKIAWVFYEDTVSNPVLQQERTSLIEVEPQAFVSTLKLLTREASGPADPAAMSALVSLLDTYSRRIAGAQPIDSRLWRLWEKVESDLAKQWSSQSLSKEACMSEEHLRRLCHKHYQRSPISHLTQLRLRRAAILLSSTPEKLEAIAQRVGYATVYSFSAAFRKWSGLPPARFRQSKQRFPR